MKFRMQVKSGDLYPWWETYEKNVDDPQAEAERLIEYFNSTLRPGEEPRTLLAVEVLDQTSIKDHTWKKTNLMTIKGHAGRTYDTLRCTVCGITARRYGLHDITIDPEFAKAKVYKRCDTSRDHRIKKGHIQKGEEL